MQKQSRREFIRGLVRYLTLGGLVSMTGVLFARRKRRSTNDKCTNSEICRECRSFKNCSLPSALSARQLTEIKHDKTRVP